MLEHLINNHLIFAADPTFGKDILEAANGAAIEISESFDKLWEQTLNGNLYGAISKVGQLFALATLLFYMVDLAKNWINQEDMKALSSWIWPIIVISLMAGNGTLLRSGTLTVRNYINTINNDLLQYTAKGANLEVAYKRAVGNIALQQQVGNAMERCRSLPGGSKDTAQCLEQAELELKQSAPKLFNDAAPESEDSWEYNILDTLSGMKDALSNLSPGAIAEKIGNSIMGSIGSVVQGFAAVILLGLANAYQWGVEFSMLLTALLGPLAVGGSLLPYGQRSIFAWLSGFMGIGMAKLSFNIVTGLCAQLIANAEENQPMIFLLFVGIISPFLASALGAGGGLAAWAAMGKAASLGVEAVKTVATAGTGTMASMAAARSAKATQASQNAQTQRIVDAIRISKK